MVRAEDNLNITLQTEDGRYHFLSRSSLATVNYTDHSLMPHDYGTRLTPRNWMTLLLSDRYWQECAIGTRSAEDPGGTIGD